jgi:hypothetical protein
MAALVMGLLNLLFIILINEAQASSVAEVEKWCKHYEYKDCALVHALVKTESGYNPKSFMDEKSGSYGLMQIQCTTAKDLRLKSPLKFGCDQLFNPQVNVRYGVMYLEMLEEKLTKPSIRDMIAAYNAGYNTKEGASVPRRCKNYNKFNYKGFPPQECYPGEYINEEYVWKVYRRYKYLMGKQTTVNYWTER